MGTNLPKSSSFINGYIETYDPSNHLSTKNGTYYQHRSVAEQEVLSAQMPPKAVVHHRDNQRDNNSPDNLLVFDSRSSHARYHKMIEHNNDNYFLRQNEDGTTSCISLINGIPSPGNHKAICPYCGSVMDWKAAMCKECKDILQRTVQRPSRELLKADIRYMPFTEIGHKYGDVSDNTIRKWCKAYGLPRTKAIIDSYSDEEWMAV